MECSPIFLPDAIPVVYFPTLDDPGGGLDSVPRATLFCVELLLLTFALLIYKGNTTLWTPGAIVQILRNERHCGDVYTRKTYTVNFRSHKKAKNINSRPHSWYYDEHEAIVSRDDYIAVQHLLDNMKYGNRSIMPELTVIDSGIFKGFVIINPRWAGFKEEHYYGACRSVYNPADLPQEVDEIQIEVEAGDLDLRDFEFARSEFFETTRNGFN